MWEKIQKLHASWLLASEHSIASTFWAGIWCRYSCVLFIKPWGPFLLFCFLCLTGQFVVLGMLYLPHCIWRWGRVVWTSMPSPLPCRVHRQMASDKRHMPSLQVQHPQGQWKRLKNRNEHRMPAMQVHPFLKSKNEISLFLYIRVQRPDIHVNTALCQVRFLF